MNTTRQGDITGFDDAEVVDRKEYMKIKVMPLDTQTFKTYECDDFEFRANNVCNWISIMKDGKEIAFIERVGVIKTISHTET